MTPETPEQMEKRLDEVLHKNRHNLHLVQIPRTPLEELLGKEAGGEGDPDGLREEIRLSTFRRLLEFFFQAGPEPLQVLRHVFAITKAVSPELIGDMSLEDISIICADGGRATVSARIQRVYNGTLKKAGMLDARAAFQKTGAFAAAQLGNQNRRAKTRPKRAKKQVSRHTAAMAAPKKKTTNTPKIP